MDCGLWTVDCGLWAVGCGLWAVDCGLLGARGASTALKRSFYEKDFVLVVCFGTLLGQGD